MAAPAMGVLARFGTNGNTGTSAVAATIEYEFVSCGLGSERELIRTEGLRGTRLHTVSRQRQGRITPGGVVELEPAMGEWQTLLPLMISAVTAGPPITYTVLDTVPVAFQAVFDRVTDSRTFTGCRTSRVTFKSSPGQPLACSWEIEALTETASAGTPFAGLSPSNTPPFVFHDTDNAGTSRCVLNSVAVPIHDWEMTVDWNLKKDRWVNSQTRTDLPSMDLTISTRFTMPHDTDTSAFYDLFTQASEVATGVAGTLTFTKASTSIAFAWQGLLFPAQRSPTVPSKDEIVMQTVSQSFRTAAGTAPLVITLDTTV